MLKQVTVEGASFPKRFCGAFEVDGVPQRDGGGDKIEATGPVTLVFNGTVPDFAQPVKENGTR